MAVTKLSNSGIKTGVLKYDSMLAGNAPFDPAATWLIQRVNGTGSSSTITFSNIPQTYQHLQIRMIGRTTDSSNNTTFLTVQFNSTAMTNGHVLRGDGTSVNAFAGNVPLYMPGASAASNIMGVGIIDIHDYASTTRNKTARYFGGWDGNNALTTSERLQLASSFLDNTNAITSLSIITNAGSWTASSTFALYGFKG